MNCAGQTDVQRDVSTPNLDRLAAGGLRFTNATSCIPVCTPARACLLTGRFPLTTGMFLNDLQLSSRECTIAHLARNEGYDTAYVGKWHLDRRAPLGLYSSRASAPGLRFVVRDHLRPS